MDREPVLLSRDGCLPCRVPPRPPWKVKSPLMTILGSAAEVQFGRGANPTRCPTLLDGQSNGPMSDQQRKRERVNVIQGQMAPKCEFPVTRDEVQGREIIY